MSTVLIQKWRSSWPAVPSRQHHRLTSETPSPTGAGVPSCLRTGRNDHERHANKVRRRRTMIKRITARRGIERANCSTKHEQGVTSSELALRDLTRCFLCLTPWPALPPLALLRLGKLRLPQGIAFSQVSPTGTQRTTSPARQPSCCASTSSAGRGGRSPCLAPTTGWDLFLQVSQASRELHTPRAQTAHNRSDSVVVD